MGLSKVGGSGANLVQGQGCSSGKKTKDEAGKVKKTGQNVINEKSSVLDLKKDLTDKNIVPISCVGRVRLHNLPQEILLARLIEGVKNPHPSWREDNHISKWEGVKCNEAGEVVGISWSKQKLKGTLDFEYLPSTITSVEVMFNGELKGKIDFSTLPYNLENLWLCGNKFTGELDMSKLPRKLKILELYENDFNGDISSNCSWPEELCQISTYRNSLLKGNIVISELPKSLQMKPNTPRSIYLFVARDTQINFVS